MSHSSAEKKVEILLSAISNDIMTDIIMELIDDLNLEYIIEFHKMWKLKKISFQDLMAFPVFESQTLDYAPVAAVHKSVVESSAKASTTQLVVKCPLCYESVSAVRFAMHLDRCMNRGNGNGVEKHSSSNSLAQSMNGDTVSTASSISNVEDFSLFGRKRQKTVQLNLSADDGKGYYRKKEVKAEPTANNATDVGTAIIVPVVNAAPTSPTVAIPVSVTDVHLKCLSPTPSTTLSAAHVVSKAKASRNRRNPTKTDVKTPPLMPSASCVPAMISIVPSANVNVVPKPATAPPQGAGSTAQIRQRMPTQTTGTRSSSGVAFIDDRYRQSGMYAPVGSTVPVSRGIAVSNDGNLPTQRIVPAQYIAHGLPQAQNYLVPGNARVNIPASWLPPRGEYHLHGVRVPSDPQSQIMWQQHTAWRNQVVQTVNQADSTPNEYFLQSHSVNYSVTPAPVIQYGTQRDVNTMMSRGLTRQVYPQQEVFDPRLGDGNRHGVHPVRVEQQSLLPLGLLLGGVGTGGFNQGNNPNYISMQHRYPVAHDERAAANIRSNPSLQRK